MPEQKEHVSSFLAKTDGLPVENRRLQERKRGNLGGASVPADFQ